MTKNKFNPIKNPIIDQLNNVTKSLGGIDKINQMMNVIKISKI